MRRIFGDFIEAKSGRCEYLKIGFSLTSLPTERRWRNNGLSADFIANYLSTFFPGDDSAAVCRQVEIKDAVSYVANELLENAMKFSYARSEHSVSIDIYLEENEISLYVTNSVDPQRVESFQKFIQRLLTEDTDKLYMAQLTAEAAEGAEGGSGLGFLTMLNNYRAELAWKFESLDQEVDEVRVTTMVRLKV